MNKYLIRMKEKGVSVAGLTGAVHGHPVLLGRVVMTREKLVNIYSTI